MNPPGELKTASIGFMIPGDREHDSTIAIPLPTIADYKDRLNQDRRLAISEGGLFFEKKNLVFETLHRITGRLESLHLPYAVVGGMALFHHGYRRLMEDVDILVT